MTRCEKEATASANPYVSFPAQLHPGASSAKPINLLPANASIFFSSSSSSSFGLRAKKMSASNRMQKASCASPKAL